MKKFDRPEVEIIQFSNEEAVTTSGGCTANICTVHHGCRNEVCLDYCTYECEVT